MKAVVSEKGQVTIPKRLRDSMGIRPGEILDFEVEYGNLVIRKKDAQDILDDLDSVVGLLKGKLNSDAFIEELRGPWPPSE
jgi:antitoxin PrlF